MKRLREPHGWMSTDTGEGKPSVDLDVLTI
jgi:hypothetical protein